MDLTAAMLLLDLPWPTPPTNFGRGELGPWLEGWKATHARRAIRRAKADVHPDRGGEAAAFIAVSDAGEAVAAMTVDDLVGPEEDPRAWWDDPTPPEPTPPEPDPYAWGPPPPTARLCGVCGHVLRDDDLFCGMCAASATGAAPETCPRCQTARVATFCACTQCGYAFDPHPYVSALQLAGAPPAMVRRAIDTGMLAVWSSSLHPSRDAVRWMAAQSRFGGRW